MKKNQMITILDKPYFEKYVEMRNSGIAHSDTGVYVRSYEVAYDRGEYLYNNTVQYVAKKVENMSIDVPTAVSAEDELFTIINGLISEKADAKFDPIITKLTEGSKLFDKTAEEIRKTTHEALKDCKKAETFIREELTKALETIKIARPIVHVIKNEKTGTETKLDGVIPSVFKKVLSLAQGRRNIMLVGPAGCGKTHLADMVAKSLNLPFYFISVSAGMSESQLSGWLVPTGENGRFEYRRASFIKAYEEGGVFLLDEIDSGDANTLTFINSALANGHCPVPNRAENPVATRHKDFICIAAANTFGNGADRMYVGRNQLDAATLDRFRIGVVSMDYDENVERALVDTDILTWGLKVRAIMKQNKMRRIISTRFLRDLTLMKGVDAEEFGTKQQWFETLTEDWSEDEKNKVRTV